MPPTINAKSTRKQTSSDIVIVSQYSNCKNGEKHCECFRSTIVSQKALKSSRNREAVLRRKSVKMEETIKRQEKLIRFLKQKYKRTIKRNETTPEKKSEANYAKG